MPMEYVSAAEAGRRIGVTEKTVRTWIAEGKLSAHHPGGVKNKLAIPVNEVEDMARERRQYSGGEILSMADLAHQISELREQLAERDARIAAIEEKIEHLEERQIASASLSAQTLWQVADMPSSARSPRSHQKQSSGRVSTLPPGAILARHFAETYGVHRSTFRDHYTAGKDGEICIVSSRPKPGRETTGEIEYYIMPEQVAGVLDFWRRHYVSFRVPLDQEESRQDDAEAVE